MTSRFDDAINRNKEASEELDRALRECLKAIRDKPEAVVEGRFRVVTGGRDRVRRLARG